ncbi:MAG: transporter, family, benzoate transport protein [Pseudonocardiales bacterium]|nr:transporter, family, benzoate transport protein [Pseudonocardiales bacterium]
MSGQGRATEGRPARGASTIVVTCAFVVLLEGYDQSVYGAVLPVLVRDPAWNLSNAQAGYVGSAAFVGMLIGALTSGWLAARISRRSVVVGCLAIMAVFGTWCALATTGTTLGVLRFWTGVGLGGVLPLTSTITLAVAPARVRSMTYAAMFAAIPIGGLLGAVLAIPVIPGWGPMVMFALPLPLIVVAIALSWFCLPDTPAGADGVESVPHPTSQVGFRGALLLPTVLLIAATLLGLLLWYGLNTWLPGIMRAAGYDLGSSLTFQVVLNAGAAIGSIVVALLADRAGGFRVAITIYLGAAAVLVGTMATPTQAVLYLLIFLAGTGAQGGLVVLNSVVDRSYPPWLRAQALGLTLGIGRIGAIIAPSVVGLIVGQSTVGSFSLFASCAVAAAILIALARRSQGLKRVTEMESGNVMPAQNF